VTFREVLAIAPFRRLWMGQIVSVLGDFLAIFAVISVATFRMHANAAEISLILVSYMLPLALISPLAGVLVDRWDRRRVMILSDLLRALIVVPLVWATQLWHLYAVFIALSSVSSFFVPAQSVVVRTLVPAAGLLTANALVSQAFQVMQILSPALAGWLVDFTGAAVCFWIDVASFLFSAFMISLLPALELPPAAKTVGGFLGELTSGLRYLFTHSALQFVMVSMTVGMFAVRCFGALLAVYVRDILHGTASGFGALNTMVGIGMICATNLVHHFAKGKSRKDLVVGGLLGTGLSILLMAVFQSVPTTAAGLFGLGFGVAFVFVPAQTLLQETTPVQMLGRVSSSMMSALALTQVFALLGAGAVAEAVGITRLYYGIAALLVLHSFIGWTRLRGAASERRPAEG
jgi:MFS transporter, DHA3 family, macrolide efflux protein